MYVLQAYSISICRFACPLCGLGSGSCMRYRLRPREIIDICEEAFAMDVGTIVLRSGFDGFYTDHMLCSLLQKLRDHLPGCAIELALGMEPSELNGVTDNGVMEVPSVLATPVAVTKDNLQEIVEYAGLYSWEDVIG